MHLNGERIKQTKFTSNACWIWEPKSETQVGPFTALHTACRCRHTDVVRLLLESGAGIHARTDEGMTALQFALTDNQRQRGPIASLLLEYGASPKGNQSAIGLC